MTAICGAGQGVFAHTTIKDSSVPEGTRVFTAFVIPHGCGIEGGRARPVIAQSAVFPNGDQIVAYRTDINGPVDLETIVEGILQEDLLGLQPFRVQAPVIVPTSCVNSLEVRIAVANWCTQEQTGQDRVDVWIGRLTPLFNDPEVATEPTPDDPTTPENEAAPGFWPTMTVERQSPLDPACGGWITRLLSRRRMRTSIPSAY
jgi:hypothetical protein